MNDDKDDGGVKRIAPSGKAGIGVPDVMEKAEAGDDVYVEFSLVGEMGIIGEDAEIRQVNRWMLEDGRTEEIAIHMEIAESVRFGHVTFRLLNDTKSAHVTTRSTIEYKPISGGARKEAKLDAVETFEIERRPEVSAE